MTFLYWSIVILLCLWAIGLSYLYLDGRKKTDSNTKRIGRLEISVSDLWNIIHEDRGSGG